MRFHATVIAISTLVVACGLIQPRVYSAETVELSTSYDVVQAHQRLTQQGYGERAYELMLRDAAIIAYAGGLIDAAGWMPPNLECSQLFARAAEQFGGLGETAVVLARAAIGDGNGNESFAWAVAKTLDICPAVLSETP